MWPSPNFAWTEMVLPPPADMSEDMDARGHACPKLNRIEIETKGDAHGHPDNHLYRGDVLRGPRIIRIAPNFIRGGYRGDILHGPL